MTKKVLAIMVAIVMVFTAISATAASAATTTEATESEVSAGKVYEFVVEPDENGVIAIPMPLTRDDDDDDEPIVDDTWIFKNEYTGADRVYYCNYIQFSARATDHNGSPVGDEIAIWLKDHYISSQLSTAYADGTWYNFNNIPVSYGDTYYFFYKNITSSTRKIRINMMIYAL